MHFSSCLLLGVPLVLSMYVIACGFVLRLESLVDASDNAYHCVTQASDMSKVCFFAVVCPLLMELVAAMKDIFANSTETAVHCRQVSTFDRFYFPLVKELLKLGLIAYLAHSHVSSNDLPYKWTIQQLSCLVLITGCTKLSITVYKYSPLNYHSRYAKFLELYRMWSDYNVSTISDKADAALVLADSIAKSSSESSSSSSPLHESPVRGDQSSHFSSKSDRSDIITVLPPTFNLTSFQHSTKLVPDRSQAISKFQSMPILQNPSSGSHTDRNSSLSSKKLNPNFKSCYKLVDTLYSVSPKNTYHLNEASAHAVSLDIDHYNDHDDVDVDSSINVSCNDFAVDPYTGSGQAFQEESPFNTGGIPEDCDISHSDGINDDQHPSHCHYGSCDLESQTFHQPQRSVFHCSLFSRVKISRAANWFQWLLPYDSNTNNSKKLPELSPLKSPNQKARRRNKADPSIKKKLSQYTLNKRSISDDSNSFNSNSTANWSDLSTDTRRQSNQSSITVKASSFEKSYESFEEFVSTYFDYDFHTFTTPFEIDPCFKSFGIPFCDFHLMNFVLLNVNSFIWDLSGFLIYSLPYLAISFNNSHLVLAFVLGLIVKFFNRNFLNFQLQQSFNYTIRYESSVNLALLFISFRYYYLTF